MKLEITAQELRAMVEVGSERLNTNAELVNSLNVFPVPDGDTGTNMSLSFTSGAERVASSDASTVGEVATNLAKGLLMGARGNSGVILSQLFRGFSKAVETKDVLTAEDFVKAFDRGVEVAYSAVMNPVEGTILTVARLAAEKAKQVVTETQDVTKVMEAVLEGAQEGLVQTPDLLPVLKEVGVVDSGGQGLVFIYEGFYESLTGKSVPTMNTLTRSKIDLSTVAHNTEHSFEDVSTGNIQFGYCTEIMVRLGDGETVTDEFDYDVFRNYLNDLGDSLLVVADEEIVKVHVHTERPGEVINYGQKFGSLVKIKVDNMRLQHEEVLKKVEAVANKQREEYAVIAVAAGEGVHELFKSLGVSTIISGGQTMNPSTEDILAAIAEAHAEKVIVLPNNKNILMAAEQAAEVEEACHVVVVPSKTITQGMSAMLAFDPSATLEENAAAMTDVLSTVVSGQVTVAVRDTSIDGVDIKADDYIGIVENKIIASKDDRTELTVATVEAMITDDSEIVTVIYGEEVSKEEAEALVTVLEEKYADLEFELHNGAQPVYAYLLAVE